MRVCFAPDYREGDPYQEILREALGRGGVEVIFPEGYRRGLPLLRGCLGQKVDLVHLHWPEAYYHRGGVFGQRLRMLRTVGEVAGLRKLMPVVLTMHNRFPHYFGRNGMVRMTSRWLRRLADAVVVHGEAHRMLLAREEPALSGRIWMMPFPDNSARYRVVVSKAEARRLLQLSEEREIHLIFGTLCEYKGIVEMVRAWPHGPGRELWVVGSCEDPDYRAKVEEVIRRKEGARLVAERLSEERLGFWLRAADLALFGFREITSSGSLFLALSLGLRAVVPDDAQPAVPEGAEGQIALFEQDDPGDFARAVERLAGRERQGSDGPLWLAAHEPTRCAQVLREIYGEVVRMRSARGRAEADSGG